MAADVTVEGTHHDLAALNPPTKKAVVSMEQKGFLDNKDTISEGDTVIVYVGIGQVHAVVVTRGCTLSMKYGALRHEYLIGKRYGSRVSASAGYVYALRPNAYLWTLSLPRRTQILYSPDCAVIISLLEVRPGSVVCESGTGSGSLSHAIAMAIAPSGHLYTHDIVETRVKDVERQFKVHGLGDITTCVHQNVCEDGFFVENACDAVFLDVPAPWLALDNAKRAMSRSRGGRFVSFSPCIEQVQKVAEGLRRLGFVQVHTMELVPRKLKSFGVANMSLAEFDGGQASAFDETNEEEPEVGGKKPKLESTAEDSYTPFGVNAYPPTQPTHTGYIIAASLLPSTEA